MGRPKKFMFCANNICLRLQLLKKISGMTNMTTAVMLNDFSTSEVMFFEVKKMTFFKLLFCKPTTLPNDDIMTLQ